MLLTKDQIQAVEDLPAEVVPVPEWGGDVRVRAATALEMDNYDRSLVQTVIEDGAPRVHQNYENSRARLVVICVIDEQGNRLFDDRDAKWLGKKSTKAIDAIFERIMHLSGRGPKEKKEMKGNSAPGQSEDSPSSSPGTSV